MHRSTPDAIDFLKVIGLGSMSDLMVVCDRPNRLNIQNANFGEFPFLVANIKALNEFNFIDNDFVLGYASIKRLWDF
jgi:hypothetical protein